mgnify:CR=1 FL=1
MPLAHAAVARNINIVVVVKNFSDGTVIEIDRGRFDAFISLEHVTDMLLKMSHILP